MAQVLTGQGSPGLLAKRQSGRPFPPPPGLVLFSDGKSANVERRESMASVSTDNFYVS